MKKTNVKRMVTDSIFASLSLVLYILGPKFSLPIFPSFLEINFSMLPVFIILLMLSPIDALVIVLLRFLIKLPFSSTVYVGEITDLILGTIVVLGTWLGTKIFKGKHKDIGIFLFAFLFWILGGVLSNMFALPAYIHIAGFPRDAIISMMPSFMNANASNYIWKYFLIAVIPFNAIISGMVILVTYPVHKRLKALYNQIGEKKEDNIIDNENDNINN